MRNVQVREPEQVRSTFSSTTVRNLTLHRVVISIESATLPRVSILVFSYCRVLSPQLRSRHRGLPTTDIGDSTGYHWLVYTDGLPCEHYPGFAR